MQGKRYNPLLCNWGGVFITRGVVFDFEMWMQGEFVLMRPGISRVFGELWVVGEECLQAVDRLQQVKLGHFARREVDFTSLGHKDDRPFGVESYVWVTGVPPSGCRFVGEGRY